LTTAFALTACSQGQVEAPFEPVHPPSETEQAFTNFERTDNATFEDVLAEYQVLNERLARVTAPLRIANAALCPETWRDPGFATHRLEDYPPRLHPFAEALLGLSPDGLHIRSVRAGTSAERARLEAGDRILSVNGQEISNDPSMGRYNEAVLKNGFSIIRPRMIVRTEAGREFTAKIEPETACLAPTRVVFSDTINGHTDGRDILITSALIRNVPDDTNLALVVAHEMGHLIAGHVNQRPSQALELEADRMALVLMARAGYDIENAIAYWEEADHPHEGGRAGDSSHPSTQDRYNNFKSELKRIRKHRNLSELDFN